MKLTRRRFITLPTGSALVALGAVSTQVVGQGFRCTGRVVDSSGTNKTFWVQRLDDKGGVENVQTDDKGTYVLSAPSSGSYILIVSLSQSSGTLAEVRQLTGGTNQSVSLTVNPNTATVGGAFDVLRAVETISFFIASAPDPATRSRLRALRGNLNAEINRVTVALPSIAAEYREMLSAKIGSVRLIWEFAQR